MGYTTTFKGSAKISPEIKPEHAAYINAFNCTRHMQLNEKAAAALEDPIREAVGLPVGEHGKFCVSQSIKHGWFEDGIEAKALVVDYNEPPEDMPELWCQWMVDDESHLVWDEGEKFYEYTQWLVYLIETFFKPWGYTLKGVIDWSGEDSYDRGKIIIQDNVVSVVKE